MANTFDNLENLVDEIADRILGKMNGGVNLGPTGEPIPQLPDLPTVPRDVLPPIVPPKLRVQGLELTQSTQFFGTGYGPNNSIPIVALKDLVVRAYPYVTAGLLKGDSLSGKTVTGELILFRWGKEVYRTGPTRPAGARTGSRNKIDRTLWDKETTLFLTSGKLAIELERVEWNPTLNFFVPAWYLRAGQHSAVVRLWLTSGEGSIVSASESFQVIPVNAPKIALVRVNWRNTSTNAVTSPSNSDLLGLFPLATRMLPFPYFQTTILGVEQTKSGNFSGAPMNPGGCNTAWVDLLTSLRVTRLFTIIFQIADIVYGVVPQVGALTITGTRNTGCGWGNDGVGGCLVGDQIAFAHEVGHLYGCGHIGDPTLASYDPDYPNYGGNKTSIGEVGVDTALGVNPLSDPAGVHDLMSYKQPQWVSPYTYLKILNNRDKHLSAPADPRKVRPVVIVKFSVDRYVNGAHKISNVRSHIVEGSGPIPAPRGEASGNWFMELIDRDERIITSHRCVTSLGLGGGCGCGGTTADINRAPHIDFVEAIEWTDEVKYIVITHGDESFERLEVGDAPSIEIGEPKRRGDSLILDIKVDHPQSETSMVVLFTNDKETWWPVAIDHPQNETFTVDIASLPGGESCFFRVVATAEFSSASADSSSFSLPLANRRLVIAAKESQCKSGQVDLTAMIDLRGLDSVAPHEIEWHSNVAGPLGYGYMLSVDLEEGRHLITATIPGGIRDRVQESAIIIVSGHGR